MSDLPIVHKQPAELTNPFAKHLPDHLNAGTVAIESERAIAEAQGKLVIAKRFPRDEAAAYTRIIDACKRMGMAEESAYSFPRGGQEISGPTIRLAEMLAQCWGNLDYGIRELSRKEGVSEMEAYAWDLQSNTMSSQKFTVRHIRDTKQGSYALKDERDIYELTANQGGRRLRARILAIIPGDLIQAAVEQCNRTLAGGNEVPLADRIRLMITAFGSLNVTPAMLEKRLIHPLDKTTPEELASLRKIHNSIRDGMSKIGNWFNDGTNPAEQAAADDDLPGGDGGAPSTPPPAEAAPQNERPKPPPRQKKGAAAVAENQPPPAPPATPASEPAATPAAPPPDAAKAHQAVVALKAEDKAPAPAAAPVQPAAAPQSRAFLNDKEEYDTTITVKTVEAFMANLGGKMTPSVKMTVKGGFVGEVYHFAGATAAPDGSLKPGGPWAVDASIHVVLLGRKTKSGKVVVEVQKVEAAAATQPAEEF